MEIYFHTIALEPARWTPRRVSRSLFDLLPRISRAGFRMVEIFEPHLSEKSQRPAIRSLLQDSGLQAAILSSYLDVSGLPDGELDAAFGEVEETLRFFGMSRVRIFPGSKVLPDDDAAVAAFTERLIRLTERLSGMEILLETHDGSIADDPQRLVQVVKDINRPQVGLLFQPTIFDGKTELAQFECQKEFIRHVHLQNRKAGVTFDTLENGVTPWRAILNNLPRGVNASLEFVPAGICPEAEFDVDAVLAQAVSEKESALGLLDPRI
jgi:sugar phosphate isomerase/epimerase